MNPVSIRIKIGKRIRSSKCRPCWVLGEPFTEDGSRGACLPIPAALLPPCAAVSDTYCLCARFLSLK